jgi:uncharacterized membrane protein YukC
MNVSKDMIKSLQSHSLKVNDDCDSFIVSAINFRFDEFEIFLQINNIKLLLETIM